LAQLREQLRQLFHTHLCQTNTKNSFSSKSIPSLPRFPLSRAVWAGRSCKRAASPRFTLPFPKPVPNGARGKVARGAGDREASVARGPRMAGSSTPRVEAADGAPGSGAGKELLWLSRGEEEGQRRSSGGGIRSSTAIRRSMRGSTAIGGSRYEEEEDRGRGGRGRRGGGGSGARRWRTGGRAEWSWRDHR
jgi:hypothetical protein